MFAVLAETKAGAARCAFGGVQFADTSATRFMPARFQDEPPWRVRPDSVGGTGTDSATIGLVTARDHHVFKGDDEHLFTDLDKQIDEVPEKAGGIIRLENKNGTARLAVWRSGFGDGMYTTYWGSTGLNRLVSLVVDFGVIENGLRGPVVPRDKVGETIEYQADHDAAEA